jgi:hypothetical protein
VLVQTLMVVAAGIFFVLGTLHLVYTFRGPKLTPRDPALRAAMEATHPVISRGTTMWNAWVGFNASHSLGAMLFGAVYAYLALATPHLLFGTTFLLATGFVFIASFAVLGRLYWFSVPFTGIVLALAAYVASVVLAWWS